MRTCPVRIPARVILAMARAGCELDKLRGEDLVILRTEVGSPAWDIYEDWVLSSLGEMDPAVNPLWTPSPHIVGTALVPSPALVGPILKEIPTTRAKSPKLGRWSSIGICSEGSFGSLPCSADANIEKASSKNAVDRVKEVVRRSVSTLAPEKFVKIGVSESSEADDDGAEVADVSGVHSHRPVETTAQETFEEFVSHASDEDSVVDQPHQGAEELDENMRRSDQMNLDFEHAVSTRAFDSAPEATFAVEDTLWNNDVIENNAAKEENAISSETADKIDSGKVKSVLASGPALSNGRFPQQASKQENHNAKASKGGKKEHLKASTPTFCTKKGSSTNQGPKHVTKVDHDLPQVVIDVVVSS